PGQPLELDKDQPDEKGVDAEEEDFHYALPPAAGGAVAGAAWSWSRSARNCLKFGGRAPLAAIWSSSVGRWSGSSCSSPPALAFSPIVSCQSSLLSVPYATLYATGFVNAHSQASGHKSPPKTSDSRHNVVMAAVCGWWRFSAMRSGSTWTSQKTT